MQGPGFPQLRNLVVQAQRASGNFAQTERYNCLSKQLLSQTPTREISRPYQASPTNDGLSAVQKKKFTDHLHAATMASNITMAMRRLASSQTRQSVLRTYTEPRCLRLPRYYSTETVAAPPPLLSKLKSDLKTAMRAKDAPRLAVLRNVLAATTNAAKTSSPIKTDMQLIAVMRKTARGNQEALDEAKAVNRQDLIEKEEAQLQVINEYVAGAGVKIVEGEELRAMVEEVVQRSEGKKQGEITKELMSKDWASEGKYVDKAALAKMLQEVLQKK